MNNDDINKMFEGLSLTEQEKNFLKDSERSSTAWMNQSRVIVELLLAKNINKSTEKIIESNKSIAASNDKYSRANTNYSLAMIFLTIALIIASFIQAAVCYFQFKVSLTGTELQREANQIENAKLYREDLKNYFNTN